MDRRLVEQGIVHGTPCSAPLNSAIAARATSAIVARDVGGREAGKGATRRDAADNAPRTGAGGSGTAAASGRRDTGSAPTGRRTVRTAFAGTTRRKPCGPTTTGTPLTGKNRRS